MKIDMSPLENRNSPAQVSTPTPGNTSVAPAVETRAYVRSAAWALGLGFVGLLLWSALAPLDEGVPAQGTVAIDNKRTPIQHLQGGIVREIYVREGAMVEAGQPLLILEQASARANMESVRQHYLALRAAESRLMAELQGAKSIAFHGDLKKSTGAEALIQQHLLANERLFHARRTALQSNLAALEESRHASQSQLAGAEGILGQKVVQLELLAQQLERLKPLVKEGFAPQVQQIELERTIADIRAQIEDMKANRQRYVNQYDELGYKMQTLQQEYVREASQSLADIHRELIADQEKLTASTFDLERTEIRSPAKGQVVGLATISTGSVVGPGQKLMDIIPENAELIIEARLQPHVIDRIQVRQTADIRFSAFSHSPLLVVEGRVESISTDLVTDPELKQSYYLARVSITPDGMKSLGSRDLQAGLPAEVLIKTGARSLLSYIAYPLVRRLHKSLREE